MMPSGAYIIWETRIGDALARATSQGISEEGLADKFSIASTESFKDHEPRAHLPQFKMFPTRALLTRSVWKGKR